MKVTAWLRKNAIPVLIGSALLVGAGLSVGAWWLTGYLQGLLLNLGTEILGAVATYFLFAWFIARRQQKADLIAQMGSTVKDVAIAAAEELRRRGWLTDGSLRDATLIMANLQGANLFRANLQGAMLAAANLQGAMLSWADLQGTNLQDANLQEADLSLANLQGAHLIGANLQDAKFDEYTTLLDGTGWTPDTDMDRFTNPDHPDFWQPPPRRRP